ncbi:unnamed protein product [Larinioides sclopetarius]|uniref:Uncharacterized protein n=1 Tax=Larinioides sclopetarius TaxID=280406 RepID=A0AAV2A2D5_9ARAC
MKAFWKICIIFSTILGSVFAHHHHQGSNLAHILAAGLIVQMLSHHGHHKHHHHGHHHHGHHHHGHHHHGHESRHNPGYAAYQHQQYRTPEWVVQQETRIKPDLFPEQKNPWAHNQQMNFGFPQGHLQPPALDAFNVPSLYSQHQPLFPPF